MHYYQFNIGDYRRDTIHLTPLEHGIYRQLIDTYYLEEEPLCDDHAKLMRSHCIRTPDEQQALKNVLQDFFIHDEKAGVYRHKACDEHLAKYQEKSKKARISAQKRWDRENSNANASQTQCERNANASQTQCERNANHKPITKNQEPRTNKELKKPCDSVTIFQHWARVMNKGVNVKFTDQRRKAVEARLKKYTKDEIEKAITNCASSAFHMGQNDDGKVYDDLTLICRNDTKLEQFRDMMTIKSTDPIDNFMWDDDIPLEAPNKQIEGK